MTDIIYCLYHPEITKCYKLNIEGRKIGSTKYIIPRMKVYQTGYPDIVPLECYYKIRCENYNCYDIDDMIKQYFNNYRLINKDSKGGTEWYDANKVTLEVLEEFFIFNNINFEKFNGDNIKNEICKKITEKDSKKIYHENINKNIIKLNKFKKPYDYQIDIINKTIKYFKENNKGILVEPCGIGKSLISCWIGKELNAQSILLGVPSLSLMKQWILTLKEIYPDYQYKIISCEENNTQITDIVKFINKYPSKCIIITTYMSSYKVLNACNNFLFDYIILDECHHLTTFNMDKFDKDSKMFVQILKIKSNKQLALTATLKDIDNNNDIISNNNIDFFGEIIDRRCLYWAIEKKILCDYNVQTIVIDNHDELLSLECFNIETEKEKRLFTAAYSALKNMNDGFSKHLLIYTNTTDNANKTIQYVNELIDNHYFDIKVYASKYDSTMSLEEQTVVMNTFLNSEYGILSSVYCLSEGWDCPQLYGQVFAENMSSNIRIVQSALRAGRKYKNDPNKKFNIIIPVLNDINLINNDNEDFQKIKEIIYQMGQEDETVSQKIIVSRINCTKQTNNKLILTNIKDFGEFDEELTKRIKLETKSRIQLGITYEKAKKIIKINNINTKDSYYRLCEIDNRLPLKPDDTFKSTFKNWIDYLSIQRKYYDLDNCKQKIIYYLSLYPNLKEHYLNLLIICNELCKLDSLFPPADLWVDYYNIKDLQSIIIINNNKKTTGAIF